MNSTCLPLPAKFAFKNNISKTIKCFKNGNLVPWSSSLFERLLLAFECYYTGINCPYGLNLSLGQLLQHKQKSYVHPVILSILLERRKRVTYTVLCVRLREQCWYHYTLAFPVPGPASLAMQISTWKTKVNKELHNRGGASTSMPALVLTTCSFHFQNLKKWSEFPNFKCQIKPNRYCITAIRVLHGGCFAEPRYLSFSLSFPPLELEQWDMTVEVNVTAIKCSATAQ